MFSASIAKRPNSTQQCIAQICHNGSFAVLHVGLRLGRERIIAVFVLHRLCISGPRRFRYGSKPFAPEIFRGSGHKEIGEARGRICSFRRSQSNIFQSFDGCKTMMITLRFTMTTPLLLKKLEKREGTIYVSMQKLNLIGFGPRPTINNS